jgi:hypothetical protein
MLEKVKGGQQRDGQIDECVEVSAHAEQGWTSQLIEILCACIGYGLGELTYSCVLRLPLTLTPLSGSQVSV